ncbi:hypothetical protein FIBSPDRAFT_932331 [Athelia psychrophila]|uniref:Uncharacterized protein n=1 Tax=Athelia psychrophila TaxID=1759441 RepID=A0A166IXQ4_9AGAM|nr:hypothetical protein FIBSPDRAFT_932331 [Fibularhizoctonia sp. CBS 109695]
MGTDGKLPVLAALPERGSVYICWKIVRCLMGGLGTPSRAQDGSSNTPRYARPVDWVPIEIWTPIFRLACVGDGRTGCALSRVCKYIRNASAPFRYYSVALKGLASLLLFAELLESSPNISVTHLFITNDPRHTYSRKAGNANTPAIPDASHPKMARKRDKGWSMVVTAMETLAWKARGKTLEWRARGAPTKTIAEARAQPIATRTRGAGRDVTTSSEATGGEARSMYDLEPVARPTVLSATIQVSLAVAEERPEHLEVVATGTSVVRAVRSVTLMTFCTFAQPVWSLLTKYGPPPFLPVMGLTMFPFFHMCGPFPV